MLTAGAFSYKKKTLWERIFGRRLCDYMTTEPAQLAGIPGGNFPSNQACQAARRMNQARNRTAGNTLFMRIVPQALTVSCVATQFARETFGICRFRASCMIEYDLKSN